MMEFFFDCSSPWTYLAFRNLQAAAQRDSLDVRWRPVLVGGIFNAVNTGIYNARQDADSPKNRYLKKDLADCARQAGLQLVFAPTVFPVNSVKAMRGCLWIAQNEAAKPHFLAFVEAVFAAYFTDDKDISQDAVLAELCGSVGINANELAAGIAQTGIKDALKANTDEAIARGAFGSPTFFVGSDMYFGNDRLEMACAAAKAAANSAA